MDLLLVLTYTAVCILVFKVFKVPLTKWTVPTAALVGVGLLGTLMLAMNYNHPHSETATRTYLTTPIVPFVRGTVIDVPVQPNTPLKQGDVLFAIDPAPYQAIVDQRQSALDSARDTVTELADTVTELEAGVTRAEATRDQAQQAYKRYAAMGVPAASEQDIENRRFRFAEAEASLAVARASLARAEHQLESQQRTAIPLAEAELRRAQYDLGATVVTAPTDGFVTQLALRPGMMAAPVPLRPVMVFVHHDETRLVAGFRQNALRRLEQGAKAEIILPSIPGKVFQGEVDYLLPTLAEGEIQTDGRLYRAAETLRPGLAAVVVRIDDERFPADTLPLGISAEVAVYSEHLHSLALIRKVLLRMKSWRNFLYFDH